MKYGIFLENLVISFSWVIIIMYFVWMYELKKCDMFIVVLFKVMFVIREILGMENILVNFE